MCKIRLFCQISQTAIKRFIHFYQLTNKNKSLSAFCFVLYAVCAIFAADRLQITCMYWRETILRSTLLLLLAFALFTSCGRDEPKRSVYYWQTTLCVGAAERAFLARNGVGKVYCRYFDVVPGDDGPRPNATMAFEGAFPKTVEVVPVVYIVNDCMGQPHDGLAEKIVRRVSQMNDTNSLPAAKELQVDCDWTMTTREAFFAFLEKLRALCHDRGMKLSVTIRLHQLSQPVPPADRGVLMMYNTGDVTKLSVRKPILDIKDVMPYMRYLRGYGMDLSTAYPLFNWHVLFRGGKYVGIMHGDDDLPVLPGDSIAVRQPDLGDILRAKKAVDDARHDANQEIILYDLSNKNIKRFSDDDFKKIYE